MDSQLNQDVASINNIVWKYPAGMIGRLFCRKYDLDWIGGDEKEISLGPVMRQGTVVFVRLLQQFGTADSFPIAYRAVAVMAGEEWTNSRSTRAAAPARALQRSSGAADDHESKVA